MFAMLQQMFDLDRRVVRNTWKFLVKRFDNRQRMPDAVEKIRIAESDMRRARCHLPPNILEHDLARYNPEHSVIDRDNRAMAAKMFASSARLRVSREKFFTVRQGQPRVPIERRKSATVGRQEILPLERNQRLAL